MSSAICFNLDQSKILSSGNGLSISEGKDFCLLCEITYLHIYNLYHLYCVCSVALGQHLCLHLISPIYRIVILL